MSIIDETRFVERLQFFNGQRLFASDLQGLEAFNREMRWLHNESLHQPGVGNGYAVSGEKGAREVTVGSGYAIDSEGREIVLTQPETLSIPPVAGNQGQSVYYDLTVSYPDDDALEEAETRAGVCAPDGVLRLREAPVFCWVELEGDEFVPKKSALQADILTGLKVRLARVEILNCQLNSRVSLAQRQSARPAQTPYIASGSDKVTHLDLFDASKLGLPATFQGFVLTGVVDTSAAEFLTIPAYTANISGPRSLSLEATGADVRVLIFDQMHITKAARDQFEFFDLLLVVCMDGKPLDTGDVFVTDPSGNKVKTSRKSAIGKQIRDEWRIVWMGVEA